MEMPSNAGEWRITNRILERVGWVPGLMKRLATSETGIIGDDKDLKRRKKFFGKNKRSKLQLRKFSSLLWEQFQEEWTVVLLVLAGVNFICSFWATSDLAWLESVAILLVVAINGSI
jgi:magnesium-transporting ATPase (P-type)